MHLIQLVTRRQLRGAEVFAAQLSEALAGRGHRVTFASLHGPGDPPLRPREVKLVDLGGGQTSRLSPGLALGTARLLRRERPDLVQANGSETLKYSVLARALAGVRVPLLYRSIGFPGHWLRGPLHRGLHRVLIRRADHVVAVSAAAAGDWAATCRLPRERLSAIPVGTPIPPATDRPGARSRLAALLPHLDPVEDELVVHAGSFTPEKDHRTLLRAFAGVKRERPRARLILVGDGPLRPEIAGLAGELGLDGEVSFLGTREDLPGLLGAADLLVLPSTAEGLPGVVLEAAARGVAVVATDVGSVGEAVADGRTGLLVPPGDDGALARGILHLLGDRPLREAMGAAGRQLVGGRFGLEEVVSRFEDLYRRLAGRADGT